MAYGVERALAGTIGGISLLTSAGLVVALLPVAWDYYGIPDAGERSGVTLKRGYLLVFFWLCVADLAASFMWCLAGLVDVNQWGDLCRFQGYALEFSVLASALWTACLAYELFRITLKFTDELAKDLQLWRYRIYHALCWGLPLVFAASAGYAGDIASAGAWCWVKNDTHSAGLLIMYLPLSLVAAWCIAVYAVVVHRLRTMYKSRRSQKSAMAQLWRFGLFPLVFVAVWVPLLVMRAVDGGETESTPAGPSVPWLAALLGPMQGALNALAYVSVNKSIREQIATIVCCRAKAEDPYRGSDTEKLRSALERHTPRRSLSAQFDEVADDREEPLLEAIDAGASVFSPSGASEVSDAPSLESGTDVMAYLDIPPTPTRGAAADV